MRSYRFHSSLVIRSVAWKPITLSPQTITQPRAVQLQAPAPQKAWSLRDTLDRLAANGVVALVVDNQATQPVIALNADGVNEAASRAISRHGRYLCAVLPDKMGLRLDISVVRRLLGFDCTGEPQTDIGKRRVFLMEQLGWPRETLTLEQLEAQYTEQSEATR